MEKVKPILVMSITIIVSMAIYQRFVAPHIAPKVATK